MKEKFELFTKYCRFLGMGHDGGRFIDICNKKSQIPDGHSWGDCNQKDCPFFKKFNSLK